MREDPLWKYGVPADRTASAKPLSQLCARYMERLGNSSSLRQRRLVKLWPTIAPRCGSDCRVRGMRGATLYIEAPSASAVHELTCFWRETVLERIKAELPGCGIADVRFVLGQQDD